MQFLNGTQQIYDLTYDDVFLVPQFSDISSRMDADLTTPDVVGTTIPIAVANMSAVAGKRMAETIARRGGVTVLPQDIPIDTLKSMVEYVKTRHLVYDTPLTLEPHNTIAEAMNIIHKRAHGTVIITDSANKPIGLFTEKDGIGYDRFTPLARVIKKELLTLPASLNSKEMFKFLDENNIDQAPVVKNGKLVGIMTKQSSLRTTIYRPALNAHNQFLTAAAIGINGNIEQKAEQLLDLGVDILVLDTAHGHQKKMIEAIKSVRTVSKSVPLVAGNIVTAEGTKDLLEAGANIIKVGVGPGAMCTTRMMTGVGRPQFSAVLECSLTARKLGGHVWADGGIRFPRDVALALAAGASTVMIGSWFAGTYESTGDVLRDNEGKMYKENYGMASKRAVKLRNKDETAYDQALKELFEEGISSSRLYLKEEAPGVEDIIDQITSGLRSAMTYAGARTINDFYHNAVIGIQSASGYHEGRPVATTWS